MEEQRRKAEPCPEWLINRMAINSHSMGTGRGFLSSQPAGGGSGAPWGSLAAGELRVTWEDTNRQRLVFSGKAVSLGKRSYDIFPDYVCTQNERRGEIMQRRAGREEKGLEGGKKGAAPQWPRPLPVQLQPPRCRRWGSTTSAKGLLTASSLNTQTKMHLFVTQAI